MKRRQSFASDLPSVTSLVTLFCFCPGSPLIGPYPVVGIAQGLRPSPARYYTLRSKHHSTTSCRHCSAVRAMPSASTIPTYNNPTTHRKKGLPILRQSLLLLTRLLLITLQTPRYSGWGYSRSRMAQTCYSPRQGCVWG